jgi:6-phosphogluconolactonase
MNLRVFDAYPLLAETVAEEIAARVARQERSTILLAGGSTPRAIYDLLGARHRDRIAAATVVWATTDERDVPLEHAESNARMIGETLFRDGLPRGHRFIRFRTEIADPDRVARAFDDDLRSAAGEGPIDLAVLGVGADGHTASLFPGSALLEETDAWARAALVPSLGAVRFTVTLPALRRARERWIVVAGSEKREIVAAVHAGADAPIARAVDPDVDWWFVDREAWDPVAMLAAERGKR